jgi:hypothetical protein
MGNLMEVGFWRTDRMDLTEIGCEVMTGIEWITSKL